MSAPLPNIPLAARLGRWSARHRKAAILGWLAFVVTAVFLGGAVGAKHLTNAQDGTGSSGRADRLLEREFPQPATERVLVQGTGPEARAAVRDVVSAVSAVPAVTNVRSPLSLFCRWRMIVNFFPWPVSPLRRTSSPSRLSAARMWKLPKVVWIDAFT